MKEGDFISKDEAAIKRALDFILVNTFDDGEKLKNYFVKIVPKELKSKHGQYEPKLKQLLIYNLSRQPEHTLLTCLHELTHHVQKETTGTTNHEQEFYSLYHELLLTALSYNYLTAEDIRSEHDSKDCTSLELLFGDCRSWQFTAQTIPQTIVFSVFTDKNKRHFLKNRGYAWHSISQCWQKTVVHREMAASEYRALCQKIPKEDIKTRDINEVSFLAYYYIAVFEAFEYRALLKKIGYLWEAYGIDNAWVKQVKASEFYQEVERLTAYPGIEWKKVTPDFDKAKRKMLKATKVQKNNTTKVTYQPKI